MRTSLSDTGTFADYNLPAATMYEKGGLHFLTSTFEPYPYAEYKPKVVEPRGEARGEWDIVRDICRAAKVPFLNNRPASAIDRFMGWFGKGLSQETFARYLLMGKTSLRKLEQAPGGIKFGDIEWGAFLRSRIATADRRIALAPVDFTDALAEAIASPPLPSEQLPLILISGGRRTASYNSWTHNIPKLMEKLRGNWLTMHPSDAERLGISDGDRVRVTSAIGSVEIDAVTAEGIRQGVVMIHQFWGHTYESGMNTSRAFPGVNVNRLHDDRVRDRFTGMPVYNGTPCSVTRLDRKK